MIITIAHVRKAGMCARQARLWGAQQGLDWSDFLTNGISDDVLIATGDALALKVVEVARAEDVQ